MQRVETRRAAKICSRKISEICVPGRAFRSSEVSMNRREFVAAAAGSVAIGAMSAPKALGGEERARKPVIDTHMHVWAKAGMEKYPFPHPYQADFREPPHEG